MASAIARAHPVAFGLWQGDLTLKRLDIIDTLDDEGFPRELARKYRIVPVEMTLGGPWWKSTPE